MFGPYTNLAVKVPISDVVTSSNVIRFNGATGEIVVVFVFPDGYVIVKTPEFSEISGTTMLISTGSPGS